MEYKTSVDSVISAIRKVADKILEKGSAIFLFGSRARGDNHENSDWDLLILSNRERLSNSQKGELSFPFVELGWHINVEINPIVHTYNEWHNRQHLLLYKNIQTDGIRIWD